VPNWTDDLILGTSAASAGDDELRSFMTQLASGISASFIWPGSGGGSAASAGESRYGNARCAHSGNVTPSGVGNGYLSINTNHVSLHHIGTTWQGLLGHSSLADHGPGAILPSFSRWLIQSGISNLGSSSATSFGTITVSFTSVYDSIPPFVQITMRQSSLTLQSGYLVNLSTVTTGGFTSSYSALGATGLGFGSGVPFLVWESQGSVTI
jgi:hypothetical protein